MVESTGQIAGLFGTYGERMREWANRLIKSLPDAEDVVQEVMLGLLAAPHVLSGVENIGGWLYTLVRRRCVDEIRRSKRHRELEADDVVEELFHRELSGDVEEEELLQAVIAAVETMPGPLREALIGNALEERTFREMSEESGVPMGTLMARKKRAIDLIREELEREGWIPEIGTRSRADIER